MPPGNTQNAGVASTFGWDTVFAVHIADLNQAIARHATSPAAFSAKDDPDKISVSGRFGTWEIVPGGSGNLVKMKVPFREAVVTTKAGPQPPSSGAATIQLQLTFLDQSAPASPGGPKTLELRVRTDPDPSGDRPVAVLDVNYEGSVPKFMLQSALKTLLDIWLNANLREFQHVFATVDVNGTAAHGGFQWLQPTHVDYAYSDLGASDGLLAVLCMTEGRPPSGLAQQVAAAAIPAGQRAAFLISKERLLKKLVLPIMPRLFPGSHDSDFAPSPSGESIVTTTQNVAFVVPTPDDPFQTAHTAQLMNFQLSLTGTDIEFGMVIKTDLSPGIRGFCRTEDFLGVRLVDVDGAQTLAFYDTRPQLVTKWTENDPGFGISEIVLAAIAAIALLVAAIATAGTALAVAALVIGLLAGAASGAILLTKTLIDVIGTAKAPTIDALLINSTAPISWTGGKTFTLTSAGLNDSLQLSGTLTTTR